MFIAAALGWRHERSGVLKVYSSIVHEHNALLLIFGLLGLMMRRFGLPVLPLIIGVILGPRIERQLRQSLQLGGGEWSGLFTEPVAIGTYVAMAVLLLIPLILRLMHRSEETLLVVEDDRDQREKAAQR